MSTLEKRIKDMQAEADAKTARLKTYAAQAGVPKAKEERLENRAEKVQERADKREGVMRSNAEWWSWITGRGDYAPATTPQGNTTNQPQTTPQQKTTQSSTPPTQQPNAAQVGNATNSVDTPKTPEERILELTALSNENNRKSLEKYQGAVKERQSAYTTLVKDAIKRREALATKQERDARTRALVNAFGSLVNVITAGAYAKSKGHIPIIAGHDSEPDTALRKSIEGRYAMENENEGLLTKLEQERIKHEQELAGQIYKQEVASNDAITKAQIGLETEKMKHQNTLDYIEARAIAQQNKSPKPKPEPEPEPKPFKYDNDKINQFVANATTWEYDEDHPVIKGKTVKKTHKAKPKTAMHSVATQAAKLCQTNGVSDENQTKLSSVLKSLFQDNDYSAKVTEKIGNTIVEEIINTLKTYPNATADQLLVTAKQYINEIEQ